MVKLTRPSPSSNIDYAIDQRGNVDKDSDEEDAGEPEAYDPQYQSLPVMRPAQPPMYKPTPSYHHGGVLAMLAVMLAMLSDTVL